MIPTRAAPAFGPTATLTEAVAEPVRAPGSDSQSTVLDAVHAQPVRVVMSNASVPPAAPIESPVRVSAYVQAAAACDTCRCCASTRMSAARGAGAGLRATVYEKAASPDPDCDPLTDTQEACAVTAHAQSRAALIVSAPVPPLSPNWVGVADAVT